MLLCTTDKQKNETETTANHARMDKKRLHFTLHRPQDCGLVDNYIAQTEPE